MIFAALRIHAEMYGNTEDPSISAIGLPDVNYFSPSRSNRRPSCFDRQIAVLQHIFPSAEIIPIKTVVIVTVVTLATVKLAL